MIFPFLLMSFEYFFAFSYSVLARRFFHSTRKSLLQTDFWAWSIRTFSVLMNMSYTYVIVEAARPFSCRRNPNGTHTLVSSPDLDCYDQEWFSHFGVVLFFIILYVVIIPGALMWAFFHYRNRVGTSWFNIRFGMIVAQYKDDLFFWELVLIVKRALFSIIANIIGPIVNSATKLFLVTCLIFGFLILEIVFLPFRSAISNQSNQLYVVFLFDSSLNIFSGGASPRSS
jgi:hypothetical protein